MAPIPEDNQDKTPPRDEDGFNTFSNGNIAPIAFDSDSSDENDNYPDTTGYMLLPQEPGVEIDDYDSDTNNEGADYNPEIDIGASSHMSESASGSSSKANVSNSSNIPDHLPDEVIQLEGGAVAPTVAVSSTSLHPEFLSKFPDGKVPSYMQVPDVPSNTKDALWNKQRTEKSLSLETAEENNILKAMSGFSLPSENVPDWAKNISEDQWNNVISQKIRSPDEISDSVTAKEQDDWVAEFPDS